jgi:hypothetical protein
VLTAAVAMAGARAAGPPPVQPGQLAGNTLSAVAYMPRPPGVTGGGALQRIMLQAYLAGDGSTLVRQWLPDRNAYSTPARTNWSLSDNRLCIGLPPVSAGAAARGPLCAVVHIWWPRIEGIGTQPYAMLNGDLRPGNSITRAPRGDAPG